MKVLNSIMHVKHFSLIVLLTLLLSSCAKVYYSADAHTLARNQNIIAIVPPGVLINSGKGTDVEIIEEQQKKESINFQNEMYSWMLRRKMQGKLMQEIQEIETTNAKLKEGGYPETPMTTTELCKLLGVDGIITSSYSLTKPMSEGAAIATKFQIGVWGNTNEVHVSLSIKDCKNEKLIWNYNHKYSGSIGSSAAQLVDDLMRDASRKMPYEN